MTSRPTAERLAEIRRAPNEGIRDIAGDSYTVMIRQLLDELDAVTRERENAEREIVVLQERLNGSEIAVRTLTRERDEARTVTDEMVERAAEVIYNEMAKYRPGPEKHWCNVWLAPERQAFLTLARRALTAALAKEPAHA